MIPMVGAGAITVVHRNVPRPTFIVHRTAPIDIHHHFFGKVITQEYIDFYSITIYHIQFRNRRQIPLHIVVLICLIVPWGLCCRRPKSIEFILFTLTLLYYRFGIIVACYEFYRFTVALDSNKIVSITTEAESFFTIDISLFHMNL